MKKFFEIIEIYLEEDGRMHKFIVSPNLARQIRYWRDRHANDICELDDLQNMRYRLETELNVIKPIIEKKELEPAISNRCDKCRFAVKSNWNNEILGCCRKSVCEYYSPRE